MSWYNFLLFPVVELIRLCMWSLFLYFIIVMNLFLSLLYAFQCDCSLYLSHFLYLFFTICLWCFRSLSHQGFFILEVILNCCCAILSMVLRISELSWLVASMRLLVFSIGVLLNSSINCSTLLSVRLRTLFISVFGFGLGILVLSVIILWPDMYDPGIKAPM